MWLTIAILIISAVLFANGKIRSDIVALCALCALLVFQILTPAEALSGFFQFGRDNDGGLVCGGWCHLPDRFGQDDQFAHPETGGQE